MAALIVIVKIILSDFNISQIAEGSNALQIRVWSLPLMFLEFLVKKEFIMTQHLFVHIRSHVTS